MFITPLTLYWSLCITYPYPYSPLTIPQALLIFRYCNLQYMLHIIIFRYCNTCSLLLYLNITKYCTNLFRMKFLPHSSEITYLDIAILTLYYYIYTLRYMVFIFRYCNTWSLYSYIAIHAPWSLYSDIAIHAPYIQLLQYLILIIIVRYCNIWSLYSDIAINAPYIQILQYICSEIQILQYMHIIFSSCNAGFLCSDIEIQAPYNQILQYK